MYVKIITIALIAFIAAVDNSEGVKFTRCELVTALLKQSFPSLQMRTWVCIVEAESDRDTSKKTTMADGTFRWGLFQLANPTWCTPGTAGGKCNVRCEDLLTDDITKAAACATTVYKETGFSAWSTYTSKCQSNLPDITACTSVYAIFRSWMKLYRMTLGA